MMGLRSLRTSFVMIFVTLQVSRLASPAQGWNMRQNGDGSAETRYLDTVSSMSAQDEEVVHDTDWWGTSPDKNEDDSEDGAMTAMLGDPLDDDVTHLSPRNLGEQGKDPPHPPDHSTLSSEPDWHTSLSRGLPYHNPLPSLGAYPIRSPTKRAADLSSHNPRESSASSVRGPGTGQELKRRPTVPNLLERGSRWSCWRRVARVQFRSTVKDWGRRAQSVQVNVSKEDALALRRAGLPWRGLSFYSTWKDENPCSNWTGVQCDASGRVTRLTLTGRGLSGTIPSVLGTLIRLQALNLARNNLSGPIPPSLGNLSSLSELRLSFNRLSGPIPSKLFDAVSLVTLDIAGNNLTGAIPNSLSHLVNLTGLRIQSNNLSGVIPSSIGSLTKLSFFWCHSNKLTGRVPRSLFQLSDLTSLNLGGNRLTAVLVPELSRLAKLRQLYAYNMSLSGPLPPELGSLRSLEDLRLWGNRIPGGIPAELMTIPSLQYLGLSGNILNGSIPDSLSTLVKLKTLKLFTNRLSGSFPTGVGLISGLVNLQLSNNQLTGSIPATFFQLTNLTLLGVWGNQVRGLLVPQLGNLVNLKTLWASSMGLSGPLPPELGSLTSLQDLSVFRNNISGSIPATIGSLTGLSRLYLSLNNLTGPFPKEMSKLKRLTALSLFYNNLTSELPSEIGSLTTLKLLSLGSNKFNGSIPAFFSLLTELTFLNLESNNFTGSVPASLGLLTGLSYLRLSRNGLSSSIPNSLSGCRRLTRLDFSGNKINGSIPNGFRSLTNLFSLILHGNSLSGSLPSLIASLSRLTRLYLQQNQFSGMIPQAWSSLTRLSELDLSGNQLSGSIPTFLGDLLRLTSLRLSENSLTGAFPPELLKLTSLVSLVLRSNVLKGSLPPDWEGMRRLSELDLGTNQFQGSIESLTSLPVLTRMLLPFNLFNGNIPRGIVRMTTLKEINLQGNDFEGNIPSDVGLLFNLTSLNLANNFINGTIPVSLGSLTGAPPSAGLVELNLAENEIYGTLPTVLKQLNALTLMDVSFNYLTGPLLEFRPGQLLMNDFSNNYFTSGCPYGLDVDNNCITTPCNSVQRTDSACNEFCNALDPLGVCSGHGFCVLDPSVGLPVCHCFKNYASPGTDPNIDYGSCQFNPGAPGGPAFIPKPNNTNPQGMDISVVEPKFDRMNKWSRYLSVRSRFSNRVVTWDIYSASTWMSPSKIFLGFNAADENEVVTNVLTWDVPRDQGQCETCWAFAAVDAVGSALTIGRSEEGGQALAFSIDSMARAVTNSTCSPGFPTNGWEYAMDETLAPQQSNITVPNVPPVVMYEAVRFRGWFGLVLTLHSQPALIILDGSSDSFQDPRVICKYKGYVFNKGDCFTGRLGHTVLVTGYDLSAVTPYWVVRNSWGSSWCTDGFMRLAMQGGDGMCGMNVYPAYYPIPAPRENDPCYRLSVIPDGEVSPRSSLNPCGGGRCVPHPEWGPYGYTCNCSVPYTGVGRLRGFVAANNTVKITLPGAGEGITQSCVPVDACGMSLKNPCQHGTCVNDLRGGYTCLCFPGFTTMNSSDTSPVCVPGVDSSGMYTVPGPTVTCAMLSATYNLSRDALILMNPTIGCNRSLPQGLSLNVSNPSYSCSIAYSVTQEDKKCSDIVERLQPRNRVFRGLQAVPDGGPGDTGNSQDGQNVTLDTSAPPRVTEAALKQLNPYIDCQALTKGQMICLRSGQWTMDLTCTKLYTLRPGETCSSVISRLYTSDPPLFYLDNPGIDCSALEDPSASSAGGGSSEDSALGASGQTICVSTTDLIGSARACGQFSSTVWPSRGCKRPDVLKLNFASVPDFERRNLPCNQNSPKAGAIVCFPKKK